MRARLNRLRGLLARYRVDRRLPPPVAELYRQSSALRLSAAVRRGLASGRRSLGSTSRGIAIADGVETARFVARTLIVAGPLPQSFSDVATDNVSRVTTVLTDAALDPFVVERRRDSFEVGLEIGDRPAAIDALVRGLDGVGWYIEWSIGSRTGLVALDDAKHERHLRHAREWNLFRAYGWGESVVGLDAGVIVTFWELGTSERLEKIGQRGSERFDPACPRTIEHVDGVDLPSRSAFPVGRNMARFDAPVDIVFTWVDGADPAWQEAFRTASEACGRSVNESALDPARYRSRDELRYSLRSVWAFCGWARRIFVVTSGQVPHWLVQDERVRVVPHSEILPDDALPTFNSHAIEAALHHIEGLAEHFIYFNDDMFAGRPLRPEDFFTANGLPLLFPSAAPVDGVEYPDTQAVDTAAIRGRELLDERFGRVMADMPLHSPYPLRRSVMADIDIEFSEAIGQTTHSRFRSRTDLSVAASFAMHYAVATGRGVFGNIANEYVHVESGRLARHLDRLLLGRGFDTFCINETADIGGDVAEREAQIRQFFEQYFPVPAPWERRAE